MIIGVTGHRPQRMGGFGKKADEKRLAFANICIDMMLLAGNDNLKFITGMALGWDQAIAQACRNRSIPFIAAVPFKGQEIVWPEKARKIYHELLEAAEEVVYVTEGAFSVDAMDRRNEWIVDHSDEILAFWDKTATGGTYKCIDYALSKNLPVKNVYNKWKQVS
jgi:uncharacterized phage-like protein YoqJ